MTDLRRFIKTFIRNPMGITGLVILLSVIGVAVFAPALAPYDPYISVRATADMILTPPDEDHILGTDDAGRDVLSELIYGARVSLVVGFFAAFISVFIGSVLGLTAGYFGGRISTLLMRFTDFLLVIPELPLMLVIIAVWGRGLWKIIFVIGILGWAYTARLVRSQVLSIKERHYIVRAKAIGASDFRIITIHILPQLIPIIFTVGVMAISSAIIAEATLSFLGLGDPTQISWGTMLNYAFERGISRRAWWFLIPPGMAIVWVSLGVIMIGTVIEEIINPRLKHHHLFDPKRMVAILGVNIPTDVYNEKAERIS